MGRRYFTGAEYLLAHPDVARAGEDPLRHYRAHGVVEGRDIAFPEGWTEENYLNHPFNADIKNDPVWSQRATEHWLIDGRIKGRPFLNTETPQPPGSWIPPQSLGLHCILAVNDGQERFSALRIPGGLLIGTYGRGSGGARIELFNGTLQPPELQTDRESIFDIIMPSDGLPLACAEHNAAIYKRSAAGAWEQKYARPELAALMLGLRKGRNCINGLYTIYERGISGLVRSQNNGNTWQEVAAYPGKSLYGIGSDGDDIGLAGSMNDHPIVVDAGGGIVVERPDRKGYYYWGIIRMGRSWNFGTCNDSVKQGFIDAFDGVDLRTVYSTDRPYIQAMGMNAGIRYAVATWDWSEGSDKTSLLLTSADGYGWSEICKIPCPHIIGMTFADGGVYLLGGRHREYGRAYFFKF